MADNTLKPLVDNGRAYVPGIADTSANAPKILGEIARRPNVSKNINASYDPSARLREVYNDNLGAFKTLSPGIANPFVYGNPAAYERRARDQSGAWLTGHATMAFMSEFGGGMISGVGALLRPDKWAERMQGTGEAFEKTYLEEAGEWIQESSREAFPVYQTEKAQKGLAFSDASWYATIVPSMASVLSIMIPARMAAILPAKLVGAVGKSRAAARIAKMGEFSTDAAKVVSGANAMKQSLFWTNVVSASIAGRMIDSTRESLGKYGEYYERFKSNGYDEITSKDMATEAAASGFRLSHLNVVFDLAEWGMMLKMGNYLSKGASEIMDRRVFGSKAWRAATKTGEDAARTGMSRFGSIAAKAGAMMAVEGTDEMTMDTAQREGYYNMAKDRKLTKPTTFGERLDDQLGERKNWDSFAGGALGGLLMLPFGHVMETIVNRKGIASAEGFATLMGQNAEDTLSRIKSMSEAADAGDLYKRQRLEDEMLIHMAGKSSTHDSLRYDIAALETVLGKTPQQIEEEGFNPDVVSKIPDMIETLKSQVKHFDTQLDQVSVFEDDGITTHPANFHVQLQMSRLLSERDLIKRRLDQYRADPAFDAVRNPNQALEGQLGKVGFAYYNTVNDYNNKISDIEASIKALTDDIENHKIENARRDNNLNKVKDNKWRTYWLNSEILRSKISMEGLNKSIKSQREKLEQLSRDHEVTMRAYDVPGTTADDIAMKSEIDAAKTHMANTVKNVGKDSLVNNYGSYLGRLANVESDIAFFQTKDGIAFLKEEFNKHIKNVEAIGKVAMSSEINKATTEKELNTIEAKYKKAGVDENHYKALINAKRLAIKTAIERSKQEAVENKLKAEKEASNKPKSESTKKPDTTGNPFVANSAQDANPSSTGGTINDESIDPRISAAAVKNIEDAVNNYADGKDPKGQFPNSPYANAQMNNTNLVEINPETGEETVVFDEGTNGLITSIKLMDLLIQAGVVNDILGRTITYEEFDKELIELYKNPKIKAIVDAVTTLSSISSKKYYIFYQMLDEHGGINPSSFVVYTDKKAKDVDLSTALNNVIVNMGDPVLASKLTAVLNPFLSFIQDSSKFSVDLDTLQWHSEFNQTITSTHLDNLVGSIKESLDTLINSPGGIYSVITSGNIVLKSIIEHRISALGSMPEEITYNDVLKYIRDNNALENWEEIISGIQLLKQFYVSKQESLGRLIKKEVARLARNAASNEAGKSKMLDVLRAEYANLETINKIVNIKAILTVTNKNGHPHTITSREITQEDVDKFMKEHPREIIKPQFRSGLRAILNVFDADGNKLEINREIEDEDSDNVDLANADIYKLLEKIVPGASVKLVIDRSYRFKGAPEEYDWTNQPVRVQLTDTQNDSKETILWITSLSYVSNGIQYGHKIEIDSESGKPKMVDYRFQGVADVLTDADYTLLALHTQARGVLNNFYKSYTDAYRRSNDSKLKKRAIEAMVKAQNQMYSHPELTELFARIVNQNLDTKVDKAKSSQIMSILDSVYYMTKYEDYSVYSPTPSIIKAKIKSRDAGYKRDFESAKLMRQEVHAGIPQKIEIESVSTPSMIIAEQKVNDKYVPRPTLDTTIKKIDLNDNLGPRIIIVKYYNGLFRDLRTGNAVVDSRFDYKKATEEFLKYESHRSGLFVLVQANNGTIHAMDVKSNTVALTSDPDLRKDMSNAVSNAILNSLTRGSHKEMQEDMATINHIVIYDETMTAENARNARQEATRRTKHLETGYFVNEDGSTTNWVIMYVNEDGHKKYVKIENTNNFVRIYEHEVRDYLTYDKTEVIDKASKRLKEVKAQRLKDAEITTQPLEISSVEGKAAIKKAIEAKAQHMNRQAHINLQSMKWSYDAKYDGGEVTDQSDGKTVYPNAEEYYIKSGALYSDLGKVSDKDGNIITNFNIKGRFPMVVTLNARRDRAKNAYGTIDDLVRDGVIDPNDEYLDIIKTIEAEVSKNIVQYQTGHKGEGSNIAIINRAAKTHNKYIISIYDYYFNRLADKTPYGKYLSPTSMNIGHELIHAYIHSKYHGPKVESESAYAKRSANIIRHNQSMTQYLTELTTAWNELSAEEQLESVKRSIGEINNDSAKKSLGVFNMFLKTANAEMVNVNSTVSTKLASAKGVEYKKQDKLTFEDTIQEVITYSYAHPTIALILNGIPTGETSFAENNPKGKLSFWNLLRNKLFDILSKLFHVANNDGTYSSIKYKEGSQFDKLNSFVNDIFNNTLKSATKQTSTKVAEAPVESVSEVIPEAPTKEDLDAVIDDITDAEREAIGEIGEDDDLGGMFDEDGNYIDTDDGKYSIELEDSLTDEATEILMKKSSLVIQITNPAVSILDANGLSVC